MIDRLVHHADVIARKGDSYRLENHDLGRIPTPIEDTQQPGEGSFQPSHWGPFSAVVDTKVDP
jgi:hypothetical protein